MAEFTSFGLDELMLSLQEIAAIPEEVQDEILTAQATVTMEAQREEAKELGMYEGYRSAIGNVRMPERGDNILWGQEKSYSTGRLAKSIRVSSPHTRKEKRRIKIFFAGRRKRGKKYTTNSEIAFLNEYGTRTINARHFIWVANEKSANRATEAALEVYDRWLKSKDL